MIGSMNGTAGTRFTPRKRIRLDAEAYAELGQICSVTIAVQHRQPVFARPDLAQAAVGVIETHAKLRAVPLWAYCVMPDHIHLVLEASERCDIITFVAQLKSLIQREAWRLGVDGKFWQQRFWDHFLRQEESVETAVEYVLHNPVRAGLVEEPGDYPYGAGMADGRPL
jgi:REP element-mobilizing transposase RayT